MDFVSVKNDISQMSLEELESARKEVRKILFEVQYQITLRKKEERKNSSD